MWKQVWQREAIDSAAFQDMLRQVDPPSDSGDDLLDPQAQELKALAKTMVGRAAGPDTWTSEQLLRLPDQWWEGFAQLWTAAIRAGKIPQAWKDGKIVLLDKKEAGDTRPIGLSALAWRIGA